MTRKAKYKRKGARRRPARARARRRARKNPIAVYTNPRGKVLYSRVLEIRMSGHAHPQERKYNFKHKFGPGVKAIGLPDGSVLLKSKKPLWGKA